MKLIRQGHPWITADNFSNRFRYLKMIIHIQHLLSLSWLLQSVHLNQLRVYDQNLFAALQSIYRLNRQQIRVARSQADAY